MWLGRGNGVSRSTRAALTRGGSQRSEAPVAGSSARQRASSSAPSRQLTSKVLLKRGKAHRSTSQLRLNRRVAHRAGRPRRRAVVGRLDGEHGRDRAERGLVEVDFGRTKRRGEPRWGLGRLGGVACGGRRRRGAEAVCDRAGSRRKCLQQCGLVNRQQRRVQEDSRSRAPS